MILYAILYGLVGILLPASICCLVYVRQKHLKWIKQQRQQWGKPTR